MSLPRILTSRLDLSGTTCGPEYAVLRFLGGTPVSRKDTSLQCVLSRPPRRHDVIFIAFIQYARALAEHLRKTRREVSSLSPSQDFKSFMDSMRSPRRKAWKRSDTYSSRGSSGSSSATGSSPTTSSSSKSSSNFDTQECGSPTPASRVRRRPPIPTWE